MEEASDPMEFDYQELTGQLERVYSPRLALRPVALADGWPLYEATRNPLFNKHLLWDPPEHEFEVLRRIDVIVAAARAGRLAAVSGVIRATGEWASLFRFQPYARDPHAMEMGVWTHDRFWAGHFTTELSQMVIDAAFACMPVDRLMGAASPGNRGSCGLMHAVGMSETEIVVRGTETGRMVELQEFEVLREDWERQVAARAGVASHQRVPALGAPGSTPEEQKAARRRAIEAGVAPGSPAWSDRDEDRDRQLDAVE
jgi:RimJ/RimL family protein N-acetyltransferase